MPQASQAARAASSFTSTSAVTASVLVWGRHCDVTLALPVAFRSLIRNVTLELTRRPVVGRQSLFVFVDKAMTAEVVDQPCSARLGHSEFDREILDRWQAAVIRCGHAPCHQKTATQLGPKLDELRIVDQLGVHAEPSRDVIPVTIAHNRAAG